MAIPTICKGTRVLMVTSSEITYGEEVLLGSPIWRLDISGRLAMRNIDRFGYYFELDMFPAPPFELVYIEETEGRR